MNKKGKIKKAINREPVSEIPYAFWSHLPGTDLDAEKIAEATIDLYRKYDLDFIKTMNNGMYVIEDYNVEIDHSKVKKGGVSELIETPIKEASDWEKVTPLDVTKGAYARELEYARLVKEEVGDEVPITVTVFSPLTIADKLSKGRVFNDIEAGNGESVKVALESFQDTVIDFIKELENIGIDGIFFAAQSASYEKTTFGLYAEYGKPYDLKVLEAAENMWFNIIHAHGEGIMMPLLRDYPVDIFNWHGGEFLPDFEQVMVETEKPIMTGLPRPDITAGNYNELSDSIFKVIAATEGKGLVITPGCVINHPFDEEVLQYIVDEIEFWQDHLLN